MAMVNVSDELAQGHSDSGFKPFISKALMNASHADRDPEKNSRGLERSIKSRISCVSHSLQGFARSANSNIRSELRFTSLISLVAWRDQCKSLEDTSAHVAGK